MKRVVPDIQFIHAGLFQQRLFLCQGGIVQLGEQLESQAIGSDNEIFVPVIFLLVFEERGVIHFQIVLTGHAVALAADVGRGFQTDLDIGHALPALEGDAPEDVARCRTETITVIVGLHLFVGTLLRTFYHIFIHLARNGLGVGIGIVHHTADSFHSTYLHEILRVLLAGILTPLHREHVQRARSFAHFPVQLHAVAEITLGRLEILQAGHFGIVQSPGDGVPDEFSGRIQRISPCFQVVFHRHRTLLLIHPAMVVILAGIHPYSPIVEHATLRNQHRVDALYQLFAAYGDLPGGKIVLAVKNDFLLLGENIPVDRHFGSKDKLGLVLEHHIVSFGIVVPIPFQLHLTRLHQPCRGERIHLAVLLCFIDRSFLREIFAPLGRKLTPNLIRHYLIRIMNRFLV